MFAKIRPVIIAAFVLIIVVLAGSMCSNNKAAAEETDPVISQGWNFVGGNHYVSIQEFSYNNPCVDVVYRWSSLNQRWEGRWFKDAPLWFNNLRRMSKSSDLVYAVYCSGDLYPPIVFQPLPPSEADDE